jgi:filamentous hemagglutinin
MTNTLRIAKNFLAQFAIVALIFEQFLFVTISTAHAADLPITPDGSTNTQIDRAANNVPIVNIAAPNSSGLSHNRFTDYNVNQNGLILNNAIGSQNGVIQTQIGGLINDNANLKNSGAASVILNEVTSNNISQINGYTEVAGRKADLILANPNGIQMNGTGFINVSKFTAVIGSANQINPNINDLTFSLSGNAYELTHGFLPKLTILGAGIDLENITSTDLVANVMNIVAPIYASSNDVNLRTGDQTFNYLTKTVTSDNSTPGSNLPSEVAIDASALGKIQAGKIFIVATKEGFGIKYSGDLLASRSGITIDNQGNIDYGNLASEIGNISITSQKGSITQNGISQTKNISNDIKLKALGNITNYGQFLSARNINLETSATFANDSSALNISDNDFTIKALDISNLGTLAANRDLDLEASSITNSKALVAGRNLTLTAPQITNDDSIYANNKITVTATDFLTNNKDIISLGLGLTEETIDDGIAINAKTLNNNKRIAAQNNVTINSDTLNNNTANSLILGLNDVNLNLTTLDNSYANIQAANNLTLRNLKLNAPDIATIFGATSQATSITNISGSFFAGNLLDFDLGNLANYTITGTLESAGDIEIKANNITNQTTIQASGYVEINASDKFTNGALDSDNSNTKIVAGTYLDITAANLLSNYGTLSSGTNLTLTSTSGNINNNINAEIIGGVGLLTLSAKNGTVNQNSLHSLVSNGDLTLDVTDFVNTGRVDIDGDFTLNVSNNLINEERAMIFASGNMELNVVNNLTNNYGAVIYAEGNLTIQKRATTDPLYDALNNKMDSLTNYGNIETYAGNIKIETIDFTNSRTLDPVTGLITANSDCTTTSGGLSCSGGTTAKTATNHGLYSWPYIGGNNWGEFGRTNHYRTTQGSAQSASKSAVISSGGTLDLSVTNFTNYISEIYAKDNITITAADFGNDSFSYGQTVTYTINSDNPYTNWCGPGQCYTTSYAFSNFATTLSYIKSGGSLTITRNGATTSSWTNGSEMDDYAGIDGPDGRDLNVVNNLDVSLLEETGTINLNLTNYFSGPDTQGLFQKSTNPNGPLFETRSEFLDQSKFFGSDYFYTRIGLNLTDVQTEFELTSKRLVGDQFFQTRIIEEQLRTISKTTFLLSSSETNINNEIKSLLDNAADEYTRLGLTTNASLTQSQINNLQKDIIWFETKTIDGATYIVPTIYLTQTTRDNLKNGSITSGSTIFAKNDVTITSNGGISNSGSIVGNNVTLTASNDILNKNFSDITALNNLSLTSSSGSITNFSELKAANTLSLTAAKDITNTSTVLTTSKNLLDSGNIAYLANNGGASDTGNIGSVIYETAGITAGSLSINAGNDFTNQAANITTTGNAEITAGNDVNIQTLQLRNRTEEYWGSKSKGGSSITDTTTNVASNINIGGNLDIISTGLSDTALNSSINIIGSNINVTGNGSLTSDFGNVNIANAIDSKMTEETSSKSGTFHSRYDSVYDYKETAAESKLNFGGDLAVNAELGTMNLIGSTLKTGGDLNVGSFTVAQNLDGSYKTNADGTFQTIDGGSVAGVNIKAAELRSEHSEVHQKSKLTLGDTLKTLANPVETAKIGLDAYLFMATPSLKKDVLEFNNGPKYERASAKSSAATTTQHSATLDVGGDMMMNSTGDVNIVASNVDVAGNALMNVDGNVNVLSAAEKTTSSSKTEEIEIGTFKLTRDVAHASASAGVEGTGSRFEDSLTSSTQKSSNINIGGSMLANVTNNAAATNLGNLTLAASNLTVGGDSIIKTAGDFNLTDAQETSSYSSKESTLTVEAGAKIGNAYVDAGYAWKAVVDAEKKAIEAVEKLKKMERLQDEGKATAKAVELAAAQVVLAQTAVATATIAAAAATAGAASAASTSFGTGMYGAGYLNTTASGVKNTTETSLSKASNFIGYGDIDIASNNNLNVIGSMLSSVNGNVTLAAANDIKIEAGTNTLSQKSKQETIYGGGSVGNNGVQLNIGLSQGESDYSKTFYTNSQIGAENGTLTLNTGNDANISGANLLAKNVALNIGNNLNVSSKQTEEDFSSSGFGFNFGAGVGAGGNSGNVGGGFNMSNADMHRLWVDDITTIKGTDSMAVNVGKDLNLTGAAILSDNLALAVTGNINKKELQDSYYSESMSLGASTSIAVGGNQATVPGTGGQPNQSPGGSTTISGSYAQNESSRSVYATIGGLDSTLTSATKDVTGGDFEGSLTLDHRLFSEAGRKDIGKQLNYSKDLVAIPVGTLYEAYNQKGEVKVAADGTKQGGGTNVLDSLSNKYSTLNELMFNPKVSAQDLTKDSENLIAYNGKEIDQNSDAAGAQGFYDRDNNTSAVNVGANQSNSETAGALSHENYHAQVDNRGISYSQTEENTAHNIGDFTKSRWGTYQSDNTSFQLTLPQVTTAYNNYANGVTFGNNVNPLLVKIENSDQYFYIQQKPLAQNTIPGKDPQVEYRSGFTTEKKGRYIDPAPKGLYSEQQISFVNDEPKNPTPDQMVKFGLADLVENLAVNTNYNFNINSTTGGKHTATSDHYSNKAADINIINGNKVLGNTTGNVDTLQKAANILPNIRENFGPNIKTKTNDQGITRNIIIQHPDHVHISTHR